MKYGMWRIPSAYEGVKEMREYKRWGVQEMRGVVWNLGIASPSGSVDTAYGLWFCNAVNIRDDWDRWLSVCGIWMSSLKMDGNGCMKDWKFVSYVAFACWNNWMLVRVIFECIISNILFLVKIRCLLEIQVLAKCPLICLYIWLLYALTEYNCFFMFQILRFSWNNFHVDSRSSHQSIFLFLMVQHLNLCLWFIRTWVTYMELFVPFHAAWWRQRLYWNNDAREQLYITGLVVDMVPH